METIPNHTSPCAVSIRLMCCSHQQNTGCVKSWIFLVKSRTRDIKLPLTVRSRSVISRAWSQARCSQSRNHRPLRFEIASRLPLCVGGDARDLALEILRTHTRDCKRCHLALARSGHGYRLIGQLCAGCIMHICALGGSCSPQLQLPRDGTVRVFGAWRRVAT